MNLAFREKDWPTVSWLLLFVTALIVLRYLFLGGFFFISDWRAVEFYGLTQQKNEFVLDLNQASTHELRLLPGIGERLANRVVEFRMANCGFREVKELVQVDGIGPGKLSRLRPLVSVKSHPHTSIPQEEN